MNKIKCRKYEEFNVFNTRILVVRKFNDMNALAEYLWSRIKRVIIKSAEYYPRNKKVVIKLDFTPSFIERLLKLYEIPYKISTKTSILKFSGLMGSNLLKLPSITSTIEFRFPISDIFVGGRCRLDNMFVYEDIGIPFYKLIPKMRGYDFLVLSDEIRAISRVGELSLRISTPLIVRLSQIELIEWDYA